MPFNFSWALWVFSALAVYVAKEVYWEAKRRRLPASITWVGPRNELFSMLRAWKREYTYLRPILHTEINDQFILAIRRNLTRNLAGTQKIIVDVLRISLDATIERADRSWHEINLVEFLTPAMSNAIKRILVGQELCGDEAFLETFERFNSYLGICAILIGQYVPYFLAAPFGRLASITVGHHRKKALKYIVPEAQARLNAIQLAKRDPAFDYKPPMAIVHWVIGTCKNQRVKDISEAILALALAALQSTKLRAISAFVDILSSPPELGYFDAIHDEAVSVFQTEEDRGKIASLHNLTRTDSALRESMRINPIFGRGVLHET
ncbi:hypothetical protein MMC31_007361 [Peltigera leucophlebia]|nr:hypothetical protein [Peltigera leucophlebia]